MNARKLSIYDRSGKIIFNGKVISLILKDEIVIQKSIEYFNDPSPCFIHRSAVIKRLFVELEDYLEDNIKTGRNGWKWEELPENIHNILSEYSGTTYIKYE